MAKSPLSPLKKGMKAKTESPLSPLGKGVKISPIFVGTGRDLSLPQTANKINTIKKTGQK